MAETPSKYNVTPDFLFIDAIQLAYRLGYVHYPEQKAALIKAMRTATDAFSFQTALERLGVGRQTQLYGFIGKMLAAPVYYQSQYAMALGIRQEGEVAEPFLSNQRVLMLVESVLTAKQQELFYESYWWFVRNHEQVFVDLKHGNHIGVYAHEPRDNASTLARFEDYLLRLVNHKTQAVRERYEGFPADIVLAILKRAFT